MINSVTDLKLKPLYKINEHGACSCLNASCRAQGKHLTGEENPGGIPDLSSTNQAVMTGEGLIIFDINLLRGGGTSWRRISKELNMGENIKTWKVNTPGGGIQIYFRIPQNISINHEYPWGGPGLILLAKGAYGILPGSNHLDGTYEWRPGFSPDDVALADIPKALLNKIISEQEKREEEEEKIKVNSALPPGIAGALCREIHEQLKNTVPLHVVITVVTQIFPSSIFHGLICTPVTLGSIVAFNLIVGQQGAGKTDIFKVVETLRSFILDNDSKKKMTGRWPASGPALLKSFAHMNPQIITDDELLTKLHTAYRKDRQGDGLLGYLMSCWSATQETELIGQIAQTEEYDQKSVEAPALSMYGGGVTSQWVKLAADEDFMTRGIGTRVEVTEWGPLIIPQNREVRKSVLIQGRLCELLTRTRELYRFLKNKYKRKNRLPVSWDDDVQKIFFDFDVENRKKANKRDNTDIVNETRLAELALRSATRLAILEAATDGEGIDNLLITKEMAKWSIAYVSNRFLLNQQEINLASTKEKKFSKAFMDTLEKVGMKGITRAKVSQNLGKRSGLKAYERKFIIDELLDSDEIMFDDETKRYYLPRYLYHKKQTNVENVAPFPPFQKKLDLI